jgi:hypothetical protein
MIARFCLLVFCLVVISQQYEQKHRRLKVMPPHDWSYPVDLLKAIDNAANYLSFVVNEDGRFKYQTFGDNYTEPDPIAYNAVRHAGTIYSLTLYIKYKWFTEHTIPTNVSDAAVLASSWLLKHIATPTDEKKTYSEYKGLLISKETELEKSKKDTFALGGNALSLVTLASLNEAHIIETDIEILRGIGRFIVKMKDEMEISLITIFTKERDSFLQQKKNVTIILVRLPWHSSNFILWTLILSGWNLLEISWSFLLRNIWQRRPLMITLLTIGT